MSAGLRMPLGFPPDGLRSALGYVPSDSDIFVVSYPKSGTTWLQYIVYLLIRERPLGPDDVLTDCFPHLEETGARFVESQPMPRLIKTHLRREMAPYASRARYLVIARNPFDCAVSFYHHTRGFVRHYDFSDGTFADFFDCFLAGEVDFGDYFDHCLSWQPELGRDNVFFLTFEALRRDTAGMVRKIAGFLGTRASASVATDHALTALIEETSLSSMRRDQQRWSSARPDWSPGFIRTGTVGGWQSLVTPSQARALVEKFDDRIGAAGIQNPWPKELAEARAYAEMG